MNLSERLREVLAYDPVNIFTWKKPTSNRVKVGAVAGTPLGEYREISIDGIRILRHVAVWVYHTGEYPSNEIDHKDRDKSNDRFENLRVVPARAYNQANSGPRQNNKLGVRGVTFHTSTGKYHASITLRGKWTYLGLFQTVDEASAAYQEASRKFYGEFAASPQVS